MIFPRGFFIREGGHGSGDFGHAGRKGQVGGSSPADAASKTLSLSRRFGGSTVSLHGDVPKTGYVVAGVVNDSGEKNERRLGAKPTRAEVLQYIHDYNTELSKPNRYLGSWMHNGELYLDTPEVHASRTKALQLGFERKEIAIFDLGHMEEVYVMSDHQRPGESEGERVREAEQPRDSYLVLGNDLTDEEKADAIMAQVDAAD